jgi:hypothetical protein
MFMWLGWFLVLFYQLNMNDFYLFWNPKSMYKKTSWDWVTWVVSNIMSRKFISSNDNWLQPPIHVFIMFHQRFYVLWFFFWYLNNHKMNAKVKFDHHKLDFEKYKYIGLEHFSALLKINSDQYHHLQTTLRL